jgi:undecaprenyl-diphosphatase
VATPHDFSFPSGHTIASFEAATALALHNKKLGIPALILAGLIAFSRLYLYVHYPTDVIVSIFLGIAFAFISTWLVKKIAAKVTFIP